MIQYFLDLFETLRESQVSAGDITISLLIMLASYAILLLVCLPAHELAHAYTAYRLGDNTAKWNGRLTLNPFKHLDIFGSLMIILVGFGYAKPVPVEPRNFKNPRAGMALTAAAGPLSNFLMAFIGMAIYRVVLIFTPPVSILSFGGVALYALSMFYMINIGLGIFNLLPIPPLDGYRILAYFLPAKWIYYIERYQMFISIGMIFLLFMGYLDEPLYFLRNAVESLFRIILRF